MPDNPQNPTIAQAGSASINPGQACTWNTANGSNSSVTITNPSRANTCTIVITGVPGSNVVGFNNGAVQNPINTVYTIPPNTPSFTVMAVGNFGGSQVQILNVTNAQSPAAASIVAQTTQGTTPTS